MPRHDLDLVTAHRQVLERIVTEVVRDRRRFVAAGIAHRVTVGIQEPDKNASNLRIEFRTPVGIGIIIDESRNAPDAARGLTDPSRSTIPKGTRDSVTIAKRAIIFHP